MRDEKPLFEHGADEPGGLREGYLTVSLPTQYPSVALGDLMGHTRAVATREDKDEVQDIGPRLRQGDILNTFPKFKNTSFDEGVPEVIEDKEYDEEYTDETRETTEGGHHAGDRARKIEP